MYTPAFWHVTLSLVRIVRFLHVLISASLQNSCLAFYSFSDFTNKIKDIYGVSENVKKKKTWSVSIKRMAMSCEWWLYSQEAVKWYSTYCVSCLYRTPIEEYILNSHSTNVNILPCLKPVYITLHQWMQAEGARSAFRNVNSSDLKNSRSGLSRAKTNRHKTINTTNRYSNYIIPEWNFQRPTKMFKCMPYNLRLTSRKMEND